MAEKNLDALFKPASIALVGIPRGFKAGAVFLFGLLDQGFAGPIYPVHPKAGEIGGMRAYSSISEIPGPVDLAIVMTPKEAVRDVLDRCAAKKVKAVIIYTSGFGETCEADGRREEKDMLETARRGGFRILGPNCMGVYSPSGRMAFFPGMAKTGGKMTFLSQSGSLSNLFTTSCAERKMFFRHVVSYGNGVDIDFPELLDYIADDPKTHVVCSYCEGVRDGRALIDALKKIGVSRPLIMWKVGNSAAGKNAAASHTGSMAGDERIWRSVIDNFGIVEVGDIEHMLDTAMAFYHMPMETRGRVAVISGPGGPAVSAADAVVKNGLELARLDPRTVEKIRDILPATGTSVRNPIDVGLAASFELGQYIETLRAVAADDNVDAVFILGGGVNRDSNMQYVKGLLDVKNSSGKALAAVAFPGFLTERDVIEPLYDAGIPVYTTPERALGAYGAVARFSRFRKKRNGRE